MGCAACSTLAWIILFGASESLGLQLVRYPAGAIVSPLNIPVSSLKCTAVCPSNCTVHWFRTTGADSVANATALPVTSKYWRSAYGTSYSLYTNLDRKNGETEVRATLIIYKFTAAYVGTYFCRAVEDHPNKSKMVESKRIELRVFGGGGSEEEPTQSLPPPLSSCHPPIIDNFLVKTPAENNTESFCVDVTWTIRFNEWCNGSSIELLRAEWDTVEDTPDIDFADTDTSSTTFIWKHLLNIPRGNSSARICGLDYQKYYEFQMRVTSEQNNETAKFNSHIYHFGLQVPARVIWAPREQSLRVGESLILPCKVDGIPKPEVYWLRTLTGKHQPGSRRTATMEHSPIFHFQNIEMVHQGMTGNYLCVATNKIVNPPNGVHQQVDTWHMSLKIQ